MIKNIILGKESLLTKNLMKKNLFSSAFSVRNIGAVNEILNEINKYKKVNIILNNFYPSAKIKELKRQDYIKFYEQSLLFNARLFSKINPRDYASIQKYNSSHDTDIPESTTNSSIPPALGLHSPNAEQHKKLLEQNKYVKT